MSWQPKSPTPPPGYRYGPRYRIAREHIVRAITYIALGRPRSLARDALLAIGAMPAPPLVRGADNLPERGPFVLLANHYERPGLWMAWPAMYLGHLVRERTGQDTHWIVIEEWESFSLWGIDVPSSLVREVFRRAFQVYGILAMPPPYAPATRRAAAMRHAAGEIKAGRILGLMPEGDVGATPELLEAREGVGSFLLLLASSGATMVPAGLYEEEGRLVARFGAPFHLTPPDEIARTDRDRWARDRVMRSLRDLLPEPLWGFYSESSNSGALSL